MAEQKTFPLGRDGKEKGCGENEFPPRPSVQFGARSAPSVPFKKGSDFVKQTHQKGKENFFAGWRAPKQSIACYGVNYASGGGAERLDSFRSFG